MQDDNFYRQSTENGLLETNLHYKFDTVCLSSENVNSGEIHGYASRFGHLDSGGDIVMPGAFSASLARRKAAGEQIKMLWQHDPKIPIGVWDDVCEDQNGLYVKGRILKNLHKGREVATLVEAGAIDGLSVGYKTLKARKNEKGQRFLIELDLWEVSLVTFPMLRSARLKTKTAELELIKVLLKEGQRQIAHL